MKTACMKYGYPETRCEVEHEEDECAACEFVAETFAHPVEGSLTFVEMETPGGPVFKRIEVTRLAGGGLQLRCWGCTREGIDREVALALSGDGEFEYTGDAAARTTRATFKDPFDMLGALIALVDPHYAMMQRGNELARIAAGKPAVELCVTCRHPPLEHQDLWRHGKCRHRGCKCQQYVDDPPSSIANDAASPAEEK